MTDLLAANWCDVNQRALSAALDQVRVALDQHANQERRHDGPIDALTGEAAPLSVAAESSPLALNVLSATFGLSRFEQQVLLLCGGMELDARFPGACAAAHGDPSRAYPTFGLALAALPDAHWSALTPVAPLRHWRLIELGPEHGLTRTPLRIDERILHYLTGINTPDQRLAGLITPVQGDGNLAVSHRLLVDRIAALWPAAPRDDLPAIVHLRGGDRQAKRSIAAAVTEALGMRLNVLDSADVPAGAAELDGLIRIWERETALANTVLYLERDDLDDQDHARTAAVERFLARTAVALIVSSRDGGSLWTRPTLTFDVGRLTPGEQSDLWREALRSPSPNGGGPDLAATTEPIIAQFNLGAAAIRSAASKARQAAPDDLQHALWDACRIQARPRLDGLARRIEPSATWDDLVLPEDQLRVLHEIVIHVRQRARVYELWGFESKGERGLGISALFAGSSGTGKTLAGEVIAAALRLDLYQIDLSQVVSKYIGETETNLRRVFDAAEAGGAVLLFDEADALFGKRSEVKDSHDRYANIEVSYLLQRMEAYRGLAILTTNQQSALDTAFLRRIRFIVQFPFPDCEQRAEIWRRVFPAATPLADLDWSRLSQLNVAGGNIRNIALHAAFLAAEAGPPVTMAHLLQAARGEYAKLEKPLTAGEIGGWA